MLAVASLPAPPSSAFEGLGSRGPGATSVAMEVGRSSGSNSSRSSGGDTIAAREDEEEEQTSKVGERDEGRQDSLSRLEGPEPTTSKPALSAAVPEPLQAALPVLPSPAEQPSPVARLRDTSPRQTGASSRASVATLDSLLTSGESVYEDAREAVTDEDWEDADQPNLPHFFPNLSKSPILPDTPPSEQELASSSTTAQRAPVASPARVRPGVAGEVAHPPTSAFEEQTLLLQQRTTLEAESTRRAAIRQSLATSPTDPSSAVLALRRFSTTPRNDKRASLSSTLSPAPAPPRPWHPKPLVLTPARTIHTPLTSAPTITPEHTRRSSADSRTTGHARSFSNTSAASSSRSIGSRPLSPASCGRASPMTVALGRAGSLVSAGPSRRRSMGYVESVGELANPNIRHLKSLSSAAFNTSGAPTAGRRVSWIASPQQRRDRSASEVTGASTLTGESLATTATRYASSARSGESPDSSTSAWSDEKEKERERSVGAAQRGDRATGEDSPLFNDQEWEREYYRRTPSALDVVEEGESSTGGETATATREARMGSAQRELSLSAALRAVTPPAARRPVSEYGPYWNGEPSFECSAAEDSDASLTHSASASSLNRPEPHLDPTRDGSSAPSSVTPTSERPHSLSPRKGKPIVIKSVTARSSAANARRSQRLSQIEPPLPGDARRLSSRLSKRLSIGVPSSSEQKQQTATAASATGLAIWPPPDAAETKHVSLAPPLIYTTDSELSSASVEPLSPTDDEADHFETQQQRERARIGYPASPPHPSGYSFPSNRRRLTFEPRDPRARHGEEEELGDSFLDVLLNMEPPAPAPRRFEEQEDRRWSSYTASTVKAKRGSMQSLASMTSGITAKSSGTAGGGFTKKLFGGLGKMSPTSSNGGTGGKKPISIAPAGSRRTSNKPRPVVSAPLELQAAKAAMQPQRSLSGSSVSSQGSQYWSSMNSSPGRNGSIAPSPPIAYRYTAADAANRIPDEAAEELSSLYGDGERPSVESYRPPPKAYTLPPGLLCVGDAPPPPPSHARSTRPSTSSSTAASASPPQSFSSTLNSPFQQRSRQGSKDSSAAGSFVSLQGVGFAGSTSSMYRGGSLQSGEPIREVLRGQLLER